LREKYWRRVCTDGFLVMWVGAAGIIGRPLSIT
jgi:hypothetical protein